MSREDDLLGWLRQRKRKAKDLVRIDIGDDAAVVDPTDESQVLTTDMVCEGIHFEPQTDPYLIGWKAMARSVSDLAAMASRPLYALVSVALHEGMSDPEGYFKRLYEGIFALAEKFEVDIVGGDLTRSPGATVVCVTAIGETYSRPAVLRSGCHVTDKILVTGSLGGSSLGHHLSFKPRVLEAILLNQKFRVSAMMDISDGLVCDLGRMCAASGVGAFLYEQAIPISDAAREASQKSGRSPLSHALYDGEDYELLIVVPDYEAEALLRQLPFAKPALTEIGHIATRGVRMKRLDGTEIHLERTGWDSLTGLRPGRLP